MSGVFVRTIIQTGKAESNYTGRKGYRSAAKAVSGDQDGYSDRMEKKYTIFASGEQIH